MAVVEGQGESVNGDCGSKIDRAACELETEVRKKAYQGYPTIPCT